jgi:hypothetical protein
VVLSAFGGLDPAFGEAANLMRHISLILQSHSVITEVLDSEFDSLRGPFRVLLYDECVTHLVSNGAATFNAYERDRRWNRTPGKLPFVPGLGAVRINAKAQLEHRALRHLRGFTSYSAPFLPSSAAGVRLARDSQNFVSEFRLADTYASARNDALTRRRHAEGDLDYFVSEDESTWHIALSFEPRRRIAVRPISDDGRALLDVAQVFPRSYVHLYPSGGLTVMLNLSLVFKKDAKVSEVLRSVQVALGRRAMPAFQFDLAGVASGSAHEFVRQLEAATTRAVVPEARTPDAPHLDYAVSIGADPQELPDAALSGLLTLDERYEIFKDSWVEARASLYGRYQGDRVVASRTSLAVATSPTHFTPGGRRRFFWRCLGIKEFASLQASILNLAGDRLAKLGTLGGPEEDAARRLMQICEHLIEFPRGLPAHHRKWLYECQRLVDGERAINRYYRILENILLDAKQTAMMKRVSELSGVQINVTGGQIGTLNLGTIIGDVENHLASVTGPESDDVRNALREIAQAVVDERELSDEERQELLEDIDLLAEEASKEPEKRRNGVVRKILSGLGTSLATAANLATVWGTVGPTVLHFFGA